MADSYIPKLASKQAKSFKCFSERRVLLGFIHRQAVKGTSKRLLADTSETRRSVMS
jgi:hypothetical protein